MRSKVRLDQHRSDSKQPKLNSVNIVQFCWFAGDFMATHCSSLRNFGFLKMTVFGQNQVTGIVRRWQTWEQTPQIWSALLRPDLKLLTRQDFNLDSWSLKRIGFQFQVKQIKHQMNGSSSALQKKVLMPEALRDA